MIIGWDVSTAAIGVCVRDSDGVVLKWNVIFPKGQTHLEKHRFAAESVRKFCDKWIKDRTKTTHVVEERLGGFTGGLTTKQTLMVLAAMNAVISFVLSSYGKVVHITPITAKRITELEVPKGGDKKLEVIKLVRSREKSFPYAETKSGNWVKGTDDMADAWLLAEAWLKVQRGEATIGQQKKNSSNKGKARRNKVNVTKEG